MATLNNKCNFLLQKLSKKQQICSELNSIEFSTRKEL